MPVTRFKIGKNEFVIVPRRRYDQLTRAEQHSKDAETARKGMEAYESGKEKSISHEELMRELGL